MSMKEIRLAGITRVAALLPDAKLLLNPFNISDNPESCLDYGYAVKWASGADTPGATRKISLLQGLTISLTRCISARAADDPAPDVDEIYVDLDKIMRSFPNDKFLGLINMVRGVRFTRISDPVLMTNGTHVQVDTTFDIDYVKNIDYTT